MADRAAQLERLKRRKDAQSDAASSSVDVAGDKPAKAIRIRTSSVTAQQLAHMKNELLNLQSKAAPQDQFDCAVRAMCRALDALESSAPRIMNDRVKEHISDWRRRITGIAFARPPVDPASLPAFPEVWHTGRERLHRLGFVALACENMLSESELMQHTLDRPASV